jgi:selenocysteine lyase/cysteine desulfurase
MKRFPVDFGKRDLVKNIAAGGLAALTVGAGAAPRGASTQIDMRRNGPEGDRSSSRAHHGRDPLNVRQHFPIVQHTTFLNTAYIAPSPLSVVEAGRAYLEAKSVRSLDVDILLGKEDEVRRQFASLIRAELDEIAILYATSEGENAVVAGLDLQKGDNVVIDELHYETTFVLYRSLERLRGIELRIVSHRNGVVDARDFEPHIDGRTRIVSVALVSNLNGFRHDMRPIADIAHAHGAFFYTDAMQAVGMIDIDVRAMGIDFLCCGGYKWIFAGFGVAPLYVRRELLERIHLDRFGDFQIRKTLPNYQFELADTAQKFEFASRSFGEIYQLGAGLALLERIGIPKIEHYTVSLAHRLHSGLTAQGHRMFTPPHNRSSIVAFYSDKPPAALSAAFAAANIQVTARDGAVRVAPALFNNTDDIDHCLGVTRKLI